VRIRVIILLALVTLLPGKPRELWFGGTFIGAIVVDDGIVITEGNLKVALRGSVLTEAGLDADPAKFYFSESRHVVMWPFDDEGRLIGEQNYFGYTTAPEDVLKRPLELEEIGTVTGYTPDLD